MKDKDASCLKMRQKFKDLKSLDKSKILKKLDSFAFDQGLTIAFYKEESKEAKALMSSLKYHMSFLKE